MNEQFLKEAKERMGKSIGAIRHEMATVRTGRANPALLERIVVDYYGAQTPLNQLATISVADGRTISIQPFDKSSVPNIEKAIMESDLGLTPSNDGNLIRLTVPQLTEERRKELVKVVRGIAEDGRVSIRGVRRDVINDLRKLRKEGEIGEDDERRAEAELQKLTDDEIAELDKSLELKEQEILEV